MRVVGINLILIMILVSDGIKLYQTIQYRAQTELKVNWALT